jgi:hypothetical protein
MITKTERTAMQNDLIHVSGIVVEGHRVASGPSKEYPYGSLERQKPFFKAGGLDLERFFPGTLNISIAPLRFEMVKPAYTFRQITWTDLHPPEDFSFSPCRVRYRGSEHEGYVYYPHPETKIRHFQNPSLIEVITDKIPGIVYGARLELALDPAEIRIHAE